MGDGALLYPTDFVSLFRRQLARLLHIAFDLAHERIDIFEFLLRPQIADETQLNYPDVNIAVEVEQVNLQNALGFAAAHRWPITKVHDTRVSNSIQLRFGEVDAVWRELFVVSAQICRWESDFLSEIVSAHNCPQDRVFSAQHLHRLFQIARFDRLPDRRAAYELAI